jgi:hypothetical protein
MSIAIEALGRFFAAINRNDMQAITRDFDPEIVRVEPEGGLADDSPMVSSSGIPRSSDIFHSRIVLRH